MKVFKQKTWQVEVNGGIDGNTELFGVNIFSYKWIDTGKSTTIVLSNGHSLNLDIYKANINGKMHKFAAAEVLMAVWIFAVYKY